MWNVLNAYFGQYGRVRFRLLTGLQFVGLCGQRGARSGTHLLTDVFEPFLELGFARGGQVRIRFGTQSNSVWIVQEPSSDELWDEVGVLGLLTKLGESGFQDRGVQQGLHRATTAPAL